MTEEYNRYKRSQARAWLDHCRKLIRAEQAAADLAAQALASAEGINAVDYSRTQVKTTPKHDAAQEAAARHMEAVERLSASAAECTAALSDAYTRIAALESPMEKIVLVSYYLSTDLPTVQDVARSTGYSVSRLYDIKDDALTHAYDVMPHRWRDAMPSAV